MVGRGLAHQDGERSHDDGHDHAKACTPCAAWMIFIL